MINKIKSIFPNIVTHLADSQNSDMFHRFIIDGTLFFIPKEDMSHDQFHLLKALSDDIKNQHIHYSITQQQWYDYLFEHGAPPHNIPNQIQCIYLVLSTQEHFEAIIWQETVSQAIESLCTILPLSDHNYMLVLDSQQNEMEEVTALLGALDSDFDCETAGYTGFNHATRATISPIIQNEVQFLSRMSAADKNLGLRSLTQLLLRETSQTARSQQAIMRKLHDILHHQTDFVLTIRSLFEHRGNISQTAEALYIHRNTLNYRINKINKETGLDIQHFPDLVLCYLAI